MIKKKMIKASTYIFGILVCVFFFIVREHKKKDFELYEHKKEAQERILKKDSVIESLIISEIKKIEELNKSILKIDSLNVVNIKHKNTIKKAKQDLNAKTKYILCAPDSTIIRILSEHEFKTKGN